MCTLKSERKNKTKKCSRDFRKCTKLRISLVAFSAHCAECIPLAFVSVPLKCAPYHSRHTIIDIIWKETMCLSRLFYEVVRKHLHIC